MNELKSLRAMYEQKHMKITPEDVDKDIDDKILYAISIIEEKFTTELNLLREEIKAFRG